MEAGNGPSVALALQGGGSHGAFTWGVLDRLLEEVAENRLRIVAVSGTSAGAINAALIASGLAEGGAVRARERLSAFWHALSRRGAMLGNWLFYGEPGPFGGFNLDWSPVAIALEAAGLVASPYTDPFYADSLAPLLARALPPAALAALNGADAPRLFVTATDVATNERMIFGQPHISLDALRASACLPTTFRAVVIDGTPYWDGGYLGNPALAPLLDHAQDLLLVLVNPFRRTGMPPRAAPDILGRLNELTFNASVVLEVNAIEAVNRLLAELDAGGVHYAGRYRPIRLHAIRDDALMAELGVASKNSTAWPLLARLRDAGRQSAAEWLATHRGALGQRSSFDVRERMTRPVLKSRHA